MNGQSISIYELIALLFNMGAVGWAVAISLAIATFASCWAFLRQSDDVAVIEDGQALSYAVSDLGPVGKIPKHGLTDKLRDYAEWDACAECHLRNLRDLFRIAGIEKNPVHHCSDDALIKEGLKMLNPTNHLDLIERLDRDWLSLNNVEKKMVAHRIRR